MEYKKHFPEFIKELNKKLHKGYKEYGDNSFNFSPKRLLKELKEETIDICGWGFILWVRLNKLEKLYEENTKRKYKNRVSKIKK